MSAKKRLLWTLFIGYLVAVYFIFWETAEDVSDIRRLRHYQGTIQLFDCQELQKTRGGEKTLLEVHLNTEKNLLFRLPNKKCNDFYSLVPKPIHSNFNAYFTAGSIKQLYVDNIEIVNFQERKSHSRVTALYAWFFGFFLYGARKYSQHRYKNKISQSN